MVVFWAFLAICTKRKRKKEKRKKKKKKENGRNVRLYPLLWKTTTVIVLFAYANQMWVKD
jgi:heme/copper-type cytochrome/quinol oxidase subunit 2